MPENAAFKRFLTLVLKVHSGKTARSENDLSSKLSDVFKELELHTVIDTSVSTGGRKRPDILAYTSEQEADLVLPAEVVIESKKPAEVEGLASLADAVVSDRYWSAKTTHFAIILLEKRSEPLDSLEQAEPISYSDLRPLADDAPPSDLGTPQDPRLMHLRTIARGQARLEETSSQTPSPRTLFSFYPNEEASTRFREDDLRIDDTDSAKSIFIAKWPGIITSLDKLFKGTREVLEERLTSYFETCRKRDTASANLKSRVEAWAEQRGFNEKETEKLLFMADTIRRKKLVFDPTKIKRSFSGAIPEGTHWYPPSDRVHSLYYDPLLRQSAGLKFPGVAWASA
ncbi:MAG: hypothetical protein Q9211_007139 [Gyalolechia sp. 1 TL-2023]